MASSAARAPGLDGIQVSDFKALPREGISAFAKLSHQIITSGLFPASWFNVEVVMIPKKEGSLALKDLRPLVIAPVAYRLFGKILLSLSRHAIFNVHSHSVGGIPKRRAQFAFLRVSMLIEHCRSTGKSFSGAAIDTPKFFDAVPHALALKCLIEVGVPPIVVHTWGKYITSICRFVSVHGAISSKPICCDRGILQGDPISMFAAAAALGLWLDSLSQIPQAISSEAWVFVDDRLVAAPLSGDHNWTQQAFSHTSGWDSSWNFITKPKTVCFGFGPLFKPLHWDNPDSVVASQRNPVYLGVPLPLPGVSRQTFFEPVLQDCLAILDKLAAAKAVVSMQARRYVVAVIVQKKLTYSASVIRLTAKQNKRLDSKVYEVVFHKALGVHSAAFALVLKGHQLQYAFAAIYCSLSDWERYFALQGTACITEYFSNGSKLSGIGPVALLFQDLQTLGWHLDFPSLCIFNTQGQRVWSLGSQPIRKLQHNIREAYRAASLSELSRTSSSWTGAEAISISLLNFIAGGTLIPIDIFWKGFSLMAIALLIGFSVWESGTLLSALIVIMTKLMCRIIFLFALILGICALALLFLLNSGTFGLPVLLTVCLPPTPWKPSLSSFEIPFKFGLASSLFYGIILKEKTMLLRSLGLIPRLHVLFHLLLILFLDASLPPVAWRPPGLVFHLFGNHSGRVLSGLLGGARCSFMPNFFSTGLFGIPLWILLVGVLRGPKLCCSIFTLLVPAPTVLEAFHCRKLSIFLSL